MFGDILSDEAAALVSSMVPCRNDGDRCSVYLPIHHSACYKDAADGTYDIFPSLQCIAMILHDMGEEEASRDLTSCMEDAFGNYTNKNEALKAITDRINGCKEKESCV